MCSVLAIALFQAPAGADRCPPPQLRPRHRPAPAGALFVSASVSLAPIGPNSEFVGSDRTNFETHDRFYVQSMPVPIIKLRYTHTLHQLSLIHI